MNMQKRTQDVTEMSQRNTDKKEDTALLQMGEEGQQPKSAFFLVRGYRWLRRKIKRRIRLTVKFLSYKVIFPLYYRFHSRKPVVDNKVIFLEVRAENLSNNFQLLYKTLEEDYEFDIQFHFLRTSFIRYRYLFLRSLKCLKDVASAKYVFLNESTNLIGCTKIRKETTVIQTWHACGAFKRFSWGAVNNKFGAGAKELERYPFHNNYSLVTVSSPEVVWAYEESMAYTDRPGIVQGVGVSRTDIFYDNDYIKEAYEKLYQLIPSSKGKKVILYAPTYRGQVKSAQAPDQLDVSLFYENFQDDYILLHKHHPFIKERPEIPEELKEFSRDVSQEMSIEELLCVSDICISDYSSLVFEYSLFEKPMVFFAYDLSDYDDWRGFYYDYFELTPGPVVTTNREMIDYIINIEKQFDKQRVVDFKNKFMSACDGEATQRILELTFKEALDKYKKID